MASGEEALPPLPLSRQRSASSSSFSPNPSRLPSPVRSFNGEAPSSGRWPLAHSHSLDSPATRLIASSSSASGSSTGLSRSPSLARSRTVKVQGQGNPDAADPPAPAAQSPDSTASFPSQAAKKKLGRSQSSFILRGGVEGEGSRKKRGFHKKALRLLLLLFLLVLAFFVCDWLALGQLNGRAGAGAGQSFVYTTTRLDGQWSGNSQGSTHRGVMYERLLAMAAHALAETEAEEEAEDLWSEAQEQGGVWKPCADQGELGLHADEGSSTGYIMVSANGGLNQQRVAVCNAVAVARLLNASLVLPHFLYSSVWMDDSQFGDIYDADYFIRYLEGDVRVVKELPVELRSLDLEAMGSVVTDMEVRKEEKPSFYVTNILPILLKNRVVHFVGFGNRLSFDPIPFHIQRLRCRCNFHALRFVPGLQAVADLLVERARGTGSGRYMALHLRFEEDMVAHSLCEFGGGEREKRELEAYRRLHFPAQVKLQEDLEKQGKRVSAEKRRELGNCPMTPEETVVMLAALGFKRRTRVFVAGASIYGGASRMAALTSMYPNVVSKEDLLTPQELAPFKAHSSQLAALDFLACKAADVFAMSDSGSQLASLVTGQRVYLGGGRLPTIRPNKKRLETIFTKTDTIEWDEFQERVRKTVRETKRVDVRPTARSVYRHPRCPECMCFHPLNSSTPVHASKE